jgi:hypothetical protein
MSVPFIDIRSWSIVPGSVMGTCSHKVIKRTSPDYSGLYYSKEMDSYTVASLELLAQEFFRLIIPAQPTTYIAYHPDLVTFFLLSQEVEGFNYLPRNQQKKFNQGLYPGLGRIVLTAIFLQEIDLKNGNIGLNKKNEVVKIDGDWCFASIRHEQFIGYKKAITPELLAGLPFPFGYSAYNWLDLKKKEIPYLTSDIVDEYLADAPHFRNEVNEAILKILLLPDDYLTHFVDAYVSVTRQGNGFINFLKHRREELQAAALQNNSFIEYIKSQAAQAAVRQHTAHMNTFQAHGCYWITTEAMSLFEKKISLLYQQLISFEVASSAEHTNALSAYLDKIEINFSSLDTTSKIEIYEFKILAKIDQCVKQIKNVGDKGCSVEEKHQLLHQAHTKRQWLADQLAALKQRTLLLEEMDFDGLVAVILRKKNQFFAKAFNDEKYSKAAMSAQCLGQRLRTAKAQFLSSSCPLPQAKQNMANECQLAVDEARATLEKHREWAGLIRKFFVDVISLLTGGCMHTKFSFFSKTDSAIKLDEVEQKISAVLY